MRIADAGEGDEAAARIVQTGAWGAMAIVALALAQHLVGMINSASWIPFDLAPNPLSLAGLFILAGAVLLEAQGKHRFALGLLIAPVVLMVPLSIETLSGWSLVTWQDVAGSEKPKSELLQLREVVPAADLLFTIITTAFALQTGRSARVIAVFLASVLLALSTMSFVMVASKLMDPDSVSPYVMMSPSAAIASMLIATALLALRKESGWPALLIAPDRSGSVLRVAFPAVLILPVIMVYAELALEASGLVSRDTAEVVTACVNVAGFAGILLWAVGSLSRSKAQLATTSLALDMAPVIITDLNGVIEHWSAGCERLYGWSHKEAVGQSKYRLLGSSENSMPAHVPEMTEAPAVSARMLTEQRRNDKVLSVIEEARMLKVPGVPPKLVLSMTDITERQEALAALQKSEARLELALESHSIGVFEWDKVNDTVHWRVGNEGILGLDPGQIKNSADWRALIEPDDQERMSRAIARAEAIQAPRFSFIYRLNAPNGDQRTIEGSARCVYADDGTLIGTLGVSLDITDKVRADRALQTRGEQFRSVLEHVPSCMLIMDDAGTVLSFSKSAEILFGYSATEIVGHHISLLTDEIFARSGSKLISPELTKTAGGMQRLTARHRSGHEIPVEAWVGEYLTHDGRLFTIFMHDISHRIENESRLYTLGQELAHAWRINTMGEITAGIAHELNQPLSAMVNFLAAAKRMLSDDDARERKIKETVESASGQALRAGQIIRKMRLFASKGEIDKHPLNLAEVIEESIDLMRFRYMEGIRISHDLQTEALVLGDRIQVQQVLINLLRNAVEALKTVPHQEQLIEISTRERDAETIEICVSDTGPGLPESRLAATFSPFLTTKETGMGVGLSVCRRIVEAHGGKMSATNRREGGAMICFTLPTVKEEELV